MPINRGLGGTGTWTMSVLIKVNYKVPQHPIFTGHKKLSEAFRLQTSYSICGSIPGKLSKDEPNKQNMAQMHGFRMSPADSQDTRTKTLMGNIQGTVEGFS